MVKARRLLTKSIFVFYPLLVFLLVRTGNQSAAMGLAGICLLLQIDWNKKKLAVLNLAGIGALAGILFLTKPENFIRIFPFVISLSFLALFLKSLSSKESILETYTRFVKPVNEAESIYLKSLTKWWVVFLFFNSAILGALIFVGSFEQWFFYSNILFYILTGIFMSLSVVYGRWHMKAKRSALAQKLIVGSGFVFFGIFAFFYSVSLPFLFIALLGQKKLIRPISRFVVSNFFRLFLFYLKLVRALDVQIVDHRSADDKRPQLIVCTHVAMFDVLVVLAHFRNCTTFVKSTFSENPFLKMIVWSSGFVPIVEGSPESNQAAVNKAISNLKEGQSFVIFPEGTRSENGQLGPFRAGSFHLALASGCSVTPVLFTSSKPFFTGKKSAFAPQDGIVVLRAHIFSSVLIQKVDEIADRRKQNRIESEKMREFFIEKQKEFAFEWNKPKELFMHLGTSIELIKVTNEKIESQMEFQADHPHFDGHFVKFPILPAISQIQTVEAILTEALKTNLEIISLKRAKFVNLIQPGAKLFCNISLNSNDVDWVFEDKEKVYSKGRLQYVRRE